MTTKASEFDELAEKAAQGTITVEKYDQPGSSIWLASNGNPPSASYNMADYVEEDDGAFIAWCFNNRSMISSALHAVEGSEAMVEKVALAMNDELRWRPTIIKHADGISLHDVVQGDIPRLARAVLKAITEEMKDA